MKKHELFVPEEDRTDEDELHQFDAYLSAAVRGRTYTVFRDYMRARKRNQKREVISHDLVESMPAPPRDYFKGPYKVELIDGALYLDNRHLVKAINRLTPRQKEFLEMVFVDGLKNREIASIKGKNIDTVAKYKCRLLKRIKQYLEEEKSGKCLCREER